MSQRGTFPFCFPSLYTHTCIWTLKAGHTYSVPGLCVTQLGGGCHRTAAHAENAFVNPSYHLYTHTHTIITSTRLSLVVLEEQKCICLSFFACGLQYGLAGLSSCPEEVGVHWQPSGASPFPPLTYGPTNTETLVQIFRQSSSCWPVRRGHVAGRNASQWWTLALTDLLLVCLPENYQPGTADRNRDEGVLFSTLTAALTLSS